jgi:hypothetical protein
LIELEWHTPIPNEAQFRRGQISSDSLTKFERPIRVVQRLLVITPTHQNVQPNWWLILRRIQRVNGDGRTRSDREGLRSNVAAPRGYWSQGPSLHCTLMLCRPLAVPINTGAQSHRQMALYSCISCRLCEIVHGLRFSSASCASYLLRRIAATPAESGIAQLRRRQWKQRPFGASQSSYASGIHRKSPGFYIEPVGSHYNQG